MKIKIRLKESAHHIHHSVNCRTKGRQVIAALQLEAHGFGQRQQQLVMNFLAHPYFPGNGAIAQTSVMNPGRTVSQLRSRQKLRRAAMLCCLLEGKGEFDKFRFAPRACKK